MKYKWLTFINKTLITHTITIRLNLLIYVMCLDTGTYLIHANRHIVAQCGISHTTMSVLICVCVCEEGIEIMSHHLIYKYVILFH